MKAYKPYKGPGQNHYGLAALAIATVVITIVICCLFNAQDAADKLAYEAAAESTAPELHDSIYEQLRSMDVARPLE